LYSPSPDPTVSPGTHPAPDVRGANSETGSCRGIQFNGTPSFDPTGGWHVSSGSADYGYKRLTKTIDLSGRSAAELAFKNYRDIRTGSGGEPTEAWRRRPLSRGRGVGTLRGHESPRPPGAAIRQNTPTRRTDAEP
jgi:hypothetical protein